VGTGFPSGCTIKEQPAMSFIASPPAPIDPAGEEVAADDWFPPIPLAAVRDVVRLGDGVVTTPRLTAAIEGAMLHAMKELADWRTARVAEGAAELADVIEAQLNGQNLAELLWRRAVRHLAAAELHNSHRDVAATEHGLDRAMEKDESADQHRTMAWAALNDLLSIGATTPVSRNRVELI
jgi:hypothetical protein